MKDVQLSGKGKIFSFTRIHVPPSGFEEQAPYTMVIVELEEGVKITGQLVDSSFDDVNIGDKVEVAFRVIQSNDPYGLIHYGFKFRKVKV